MPHRIAEYVYPFASRRTTNVMVLENVLEASSPAYDHRGGGNRRVADVCYRPPEMPMRRSMPMRVVLRRMSREPSSSGIVAS